MKETSGISHSILKLLYMLWGGGFLAVFANLEKKNRYIPLTKKRSFLQGPLRALYLDLLIILKVPFILR